MDPLNEEIRQSITKNLPAQVGDVLKRRLDEITSLEARIELQKRDIANLTNSNATIEAKLTKHIELDARQKALDEREKDLRAESERIILKEVAMDRIVADTRAAGAQACVSAVHQALALMNGGGKKDDTWNFSGNFNIPWPTPGGYPQNQTGSFRISKTQ